MENSRSISPLTLGDAVEVLGMAPVEECDHEMFVEMDWDGDEETREAVEDWLYWSRKGYQF